MSAAATAAVPGMQAAPKRHSLLLWVCCVSQFMVILDVAIVNVALPSIRASLGFSEIDLQWIVNAYTIAFAGFLMLGGRAADLFGQRRMIVAGLLLFACASLAGGTASDQAMLVGARAAQGLGGALMASSSLAIITSSFAPGPERHHAIALWGAMNGAGGAAGTLLGGIITQELSWRWILLINLPIGIVMALVARVVVVDRRRDGQASDFDLAGALAVTGGLLALVYGIVSAGSHGWGSLIALGPILLGLALLAAFLVIEGRLVAAPLVPLRVFSNHLLRVSNLVVFMFSAALFPMWYFGTLYLQVVLRLPPIAAGLAFLPMALTIMACATQGGRLVARFGAGPVLGCGLVLMAAGLALFVGVSVNGSYVADFLAPGLLAAVGVGLSVVPSTIAATATAAPSEAGLASGLVNTSRQMGGALGLAILTSLAALYTTHLVDADFRAPILALDDGYRLAFLIGAGFATSGAVVAFRFIPKTVRPPGHAGQSPSAPPAAAAGGGPQTGAPTPAPASAAPTPTPAPAPAPAADPAPAQDPAHATDPAGAQAPASATSENGSMGPPAGATPSAPPAEPSGLAHPVERPSLERSLIDSSATTVVFSLYGGGRWPLADGSMTVRMADARHSGRTVRP